MTTDPTASSDTARPDDDLVDYLRRAAVAVYIAMDTVAADDLSPRLKEAADELDRLRDREIELEEVIETDAHDLDQMRTSLQAAKWDAESIASQMDRTIELLDQRGTPMTVEVQHG